MKSLISSLTDSCVSALKKIATGRLILALLLLGAVLFVFVLPNTAIMRLVSRGSATAGRAAEVNEVNEVDGADGADGAAKDLSLLDTLFFYTPDEAYKLISAYGETGRDHYRRFLLTADILWPITYTLFFSLLISWLAQRRLKHNGPLQALCLVPFAAFLFDLLENGSIFIMLSHYPAELTGLAFFAAISTMLKWVSVAVSVVLIAALGALYAARLIPAGKSGV